QYYELTRALRYQLHVNFYRYYFLTHAITNIQSQLASLGDLIDFYKQQYDKGNISLQELTRLNTTHFGITSRVNEIQSELVGVQETLKILLSDNRTIWPLTTTTSIPTIPVVTLAELQDKALVNRPEMKTV